jgi:hypothetical protein
MAELSWNATKAIMNFQDESYCRVMIIANLVGIKLKLLVLQRF